MKENTTYLNQTIGEVSKINRCCCSDTA